jgi:hypothetical protein
MQAALTGTSLQINRDYSTTPARPSVLLIFDRLVDQPQFQALGDQALKLVDLPGDMGLGQRTESGRTQLKVTPVLSARGFADRIDFGRVKRVQGRRIEVELTPPPDEPRAKAATIPGAPAG